MYVQSMPRPRVFSAGAKTNRGVDKQGAQENSGLRPIGPDITQIEVVRRSWFGGAIALETPGAVWDKPPQDVGCARTSLERASEYGRATPITDLSPLAALQVLERLEIGGAEVSDLLPVAHVAKVVGP